VSGLKAERRFSLYCRGQQEANGTWTAAPETFKCIYLCMLRVFLVSGFVMLFKESRRSRM